MKNEFDGQIFVLDQTPPPPPSHAAFPIADEEVEFQPYFIDETGRATENTLYERTLFKSKDPTSLPNTRKKCVKWARVGPVKTCVGWKIQYRWLYVIGVLKVTTSTPVNIGAAVEECLKSAAIIGAITAIISGGTAAIAAAEGALETCLVSKLGSNLLSVTIDLQHKRGDWE